MNRIVVSLILVFAMGLVAPPDSSAVSMNWTWVGNVGNAADTTVANDGTSGYGSVGYGFNIDKYDVTNSQYVEFLNAKDPTGANTLGLYYSLPGAYSVYNGITYSPSKPNGSKYSVIAGRGNHPVNGVSWYDAIRFANWLNNGQGNGDTETGAYTLGPLGAGGLPIDGNSIERNAGSTVFLPSEDEWYKAAYYNPATGSYFKVGTSSNGYIASVPTAAPYSVNTDDAVGNLTDVGAYTGTTSPYGAFDMCGNVAQWDEALIGGDSRGLRGGSFTNLYPSSFRANDPGYYHNPAFGFRVVTVPIIEGTWAGTNGTNWADSENWSGAVPGATAGTMNSEAALFNQTALNSALTVDAGRNVSDIIFDTASVNSMTIGTIGGNALLLTGGGTIQITSTVVNAQTVNAPLVLEGDYSFTTGASNSSATLSFGGGITPGATSGLTTLTLNGGNTGANTISGVMADNGAGRLAVTKDGAGLWILSGANTYSGNTTVLGGTLKFNVTSGTPTIGAGVTVTVASGATLELAGSVSALGMTGGNRVHLVNNSTAAGVVVSGTNQVVGAIDGSGTTQVNASSDLTADHIIQTALIIGGTAGSPALVTIDASDASGNPLGQASGFALAESLTPNAPFGSAGINSANLNAGGGSLANGSTLGSGTPGSTLNSSAAAVPEPATLLLALLGLAAIGCLPRHK